jgi:hypothetical protein
MESKTGNRNTEPQQGHLRLAAPLHSSPSSAGPTLKNSGMTEPLYRGNPKYVKSLFLTVASLR